MSTLYTARIGHPGPTASPSASSGFFRHHGVWAPGVRLFRRLGFIAKTSLIALVFMVPLATLLVLHLNAQQQAIDGALRERVALQMPQPARGGAQAPALPAASTEAQLQQRIDSAVRHRKAMLALVAVSLLVAAYLFHCFYRVTVGGLGEVARHLRAMTQGDLTTSPRPWGRDEAAQLMVSLSEMQHSVRVIVGEVRVASDELVQASREIASASLDLSQRSEEAAANLEKSALAIDEVSATVRHTTGNSQEAARLANDNAKVAEVGGRTITAVVQTMQGVQGSSARIEDITGVIDGIAFRTNILALNAAVEAARAGEQGKGFAVVASEVRALAQRSATAAREIKALIAASVEQVGAGTRVVGEAGQTMQQLVGTAERMRSLLSEIAAGAAEQSAGIARIGASIQALDRQTQQNAARVDQTATAGGALHDHALALAQRVSKFKLP